MPSWSASARVSCPRPERRWRWGANPQLGFGRIYARPQVAKFLDVCVQRLINDPEYGWDTFHHDITHTGITVWGAAIDTLENTARFAKGATTGPMTVLHLFNQPMALTKPLRGLHRKPRAPQGDRGYGN